MREKQTCEKGGTSRTVLSRTNVFGSDKLKPVRCPLKHFRNSTFSERGRSASCDNCISLFLKRPGISIHERISTKILAPVNKTAEN